MGRLVVWLIRLLKQTNSFHQAHLTRRMACMRRNGDQYPANRPKALLLCRPTAFRERRTSGAKSAFATSLDHIPQKCTLASFLRISSKDHDARCGVVWTHRMRHVIDDTRHNSRTGIFAMWICAACLPYERVCISAHVRFAEFREEDLVMSSLMQYRLISDPRKWRLH